MIVVVSVVEVCKTTGLSDGPVFFHWGIVVLVWNVLEIVYGSFEEVIRKTWDVIYE